jgi:PAS domain S-box-containing protein
MKKIEEEANTILNVLSLEDDLKDAELLNEMLVDAGYLVSMDIAKAEKEYVGFLKARNYDLIISDNSLPNFDAFAALKVTHALKPEIPFICVSGTIGEEKSVELLKQGASDYVLKDRLGRLVLAVGRALKEKKIQREKKQAVKALNDSYAFSESILKTIPFGMDIVDETGTVLFQSEQFKNIFGESAIEKKCWELYRDDKKQCIDCPLFKGITLGKTETYESYGILGGRIFEISHTGIMYQGKITMLEIFQDITERKEYEANLIKAKEKAEESNRLKSAFLQNISHEIRTPMNGILGFSELLKKTNLTDDDQKRFIDIIGESCERMLNTINSIMDISKIEAGLISLNISESDINKQIESLHEFFKPMAESKGLQLSFNNGLLSNEAIIKTDKGKINSILTNLVNNAFKFTDAGSVECGYEKKGKFLEFFVKDTGIGIPKDRLDAIFERFIKADIEDRQAYQGSGLGLTICKSYVEMLGGEIWIESQEGLGSTFYFTLPYNAVLKEKTVINNAVSEIEEVQIKDLKILIAEDEEISALIITEALQEISPKIIYAETGVEAIKACRNNPDLDLVLMDIRMSEMDGLEATRQIRQFNKDVIIIAQTAHVFAADREKAIEAGCNDYISKPIDMTLLHGLIKKHCDK